MHFNNTVQHPSSPFTANGKEVLFLRSDDNDDHDSDDEEYDDHDKDVNDEWVVIASILLSLGGCIF